MRFTLRGSVFALTAFALFVVDELFIIWQFEMTEHPASIFKDFWGITYNISNSFILFIAMFALFVAYMQSNEARKSRIADVFIEIEGRWSSLDLEKGKSVVQTILTEFIKNYLASDGENLGTAMADDDNMKVLQSFFDQRLSTIMQNDADSYEYVTSLFDFFDYIGLLVKNGYLNMDEISSMMGDNALLTYDLTEAHLIRLRDSRRKLHLARNLPGAPVLYNFFFSFALSLRERFRKPNPRRL